MSLRSLRAFAVALLILALLPTLALAQRFAVPGRMPKSTFAVLSCRDMKGAWNAFAAHPGAPAVQKFLKTPGAFPFPAWRDFLSRQVELELALGFPIAIDRLATETMRGFDFYWLTPAPGSTGPAWVLVLNFNEENAAASLHQRLISEAQAALGQAAVAERQAPPAYLYHTIPTEQLALGLIGPILVLSSTEDGVKEFLAAKDNAPLQLADEYRDTLRHIQGLPNHVWGYIDATAITDAAMVPPVFGPSAAGKRVVLSVEFNKRYVKAALFTPAGLLSPAEKGELAGGPTGLGAGKFLPPAGVFTYSTGRLNMPALMQKAATTEAGAMLPMLDAMGGNVSFSRDIVPQIGDSFAISVTKIPTDLTKPDPSQYDLTFAVKVKEPTRFREVLAKLEASLTPLLRQGAPPNAEVFVSIPGGQLAMRSLALRNLSGGAIPFDPSYSITDDGFFLFAMSPDSLKAAFERARNRGSNFTEPPESALLDTVLAMDRTDRAAVDLAPASAAVASSAANRRLGLQEMQVINAAAELLPNFGILNISNSLNAERHALEIVALLP